MVVRPVALLVVLAVVCSSMAGLLPGDVQAASPAPDAAAPPGPRLTSIVPPPPQTIDWLRAQGESLPAALQQLKAAPSPVKPRRVLGNVNLLAILVDFVDKPATVTSLTVLDSLLFAAPVAGRGSVRDYYDEVSHAQVTLVTANLPSSTGWQRAIQPNSFYANGQYGWGAYPQNAGRMVEDVLPLVDPLVDFSSYDNDGDGWVDTLLVLHAGTGGEFSLNANDIWSHAATISLMGGNQYYGDGVGLDAYVTVPEYWDPSLVSPSATDMTIGVICHEIAHGLWGLPDLYDLDGSSYGIGTWGLMSYGDWNGPAKWNPFTSLWVTDGSSPAWPEAFSRVLMGFDGYTLQLGSGVVTLAPAETTPNAMIRLKSSRLQPQEYFLLENRQRFVGGYDEYLPGNGLLIWHVDEAKGSIYGGPDNDAECTTIPHCWGNCWSNHYLAALEQGDGADDLELAANYGDGGDPLPGTSGRTSWRPYVVSPVNPESGSWNDSQCVTHSCLDVTNIVCPALGNCSLIINQAACAPAEADLGDAPASANHLSLPMTAYQVPHTAASFPTVAGSGLGGPRHRFAGVDAWLGSSVTPELDADQAPDMDGMTNISPTLDLADMDSLATGLDDGLPLPLALVPCVGQPWQFNLTVIGMPLHTPMPRYVNAWLDWNHDGDWADTFTCPGGAPAPEWALRDQVFGLWPGTYSLPSLPIVPKIELTKDVPWETWLRLSVAEMTAPAPYDGRGPAMGYDLGETEDYRLWLMPSLGKTVEAPAQLQPGDVITYHLQLTSAGNVVGAGAVLSDVLPLGANYLWSTPPSVYNPATRTVRWDVSLTPGMGTMMDVMVLYTGQVGRVTNTAYVLWGDTIWREASITVGANHMVYLPIVVRNGP